MEDLSLDLEEKIDKNKIDVWTCPEYVTKYITGVSLEWGMPWWQVDHVSFVCDIYKKHITMKIIVSYGRCHFNF